MVSTINTILAIDDARDTLMLLEFDLADEGYHVLTAESGEQGIEIVKQQPVDIILLDMFMPGLSGLETLQQIRSEPGLSETPIIMLSASDNEDQIVAALELGAVDYVTKPYIAKVLLARIRTSLRLVEKTKALASLAKIDFLTGIHNRLSYEESSKQALSQAKRNEHEITFAIIDIDHFKNVNDSYGHSAGDDILKLVAKHLTLSFRDYDIVGRIGGEEFGICMPHTNLYEAEQACERARKNIEQLTTATFDNNEQAINVNVTISIGVFACSLNDMMLESAMKHADGALYKAKEQGRNQVVIADINTSEIPAEVVESQKKQASEINQNQEEVMSDNIYEFPGIDIDIGVNNVLGDRSLFEEILVMFYQDHGHDKDKIDTALKTSDAAALKSLVHTLKGVSCSVGAMMLFEHTKKLDAAINETNENEYQALFKPVAESLDLVMNGIQTKLADKI